MESGKKAVLSALFLGFSAIFFAIIQPYHNRKEWRRLQQEIDARGYMEERGLSNPNALPEWRDVFAEDENGNSSSNEL